MEITSLNEVDRVITDRAKNLNDLYFKDINVVVGLFQSTIHEELEWDEIFAQKKAPSFVFSKKDLDLVKKAFFKKEVYDTEFKKLKDYFNKNIPVIIWFGKSLSQNKKYCVNHVVAHELQHIKQKETDLTTFYKDRVLSFLPEKKISTETPAEIDAIYFANMTITRDYKDYDWVKETQKLFDENLGKIESINEAIVKKENIIVDGEGFLERLDQNKRNLFQHYFDKTKCQNRIKIEKRV